MIRAYCFPSGLIDFGNAIPKGATVIARGPAKELREFIEVKARRDNRARRVVRPGKVFGRTEKTLRVPGVPEADNQIAAASALERWLKWIAIAPPKGVRVLSS